MILSLTLFISEQGFRLKVGSHLAFGKKSTGYESRWAVATYSSS